MTTTSPSRPRRCAQPVVDWTTRGTAPPPRSETGALLFLDGVTASVVRGDYVDPKTAKTTVEYWCETWLNGYQTRRPGTVKMARVHIKLIDKEFGSLPLSAVRPSRAAVAVVLAARKDSSRTKKLAD
jgi:hypothetical protein